MQEHALGGFSVDDVANDRVSDVRHVYAQLVGSSGFWLQFDETFVVLDVENVVGRLGGFAFGIDAEGARFGWRATDRQVDECFGMFRRTFDDGDVGFFGFWLR